MSNISSFILGMAAGALAGAGGMYLYSRHKEKELFIEIDELIEENESLRHPKKDADKVEESEEVPEEDEFVSKYHQYKAASGETTQSIFEKKKVKEEIDKVTEGQKAIKEDPEFRPDIDGIEEITDEELEKYEEDENFNTVYLDYDFNKDALIWGAGTDTETLAEAKFKKGRDRLIGNFWKWATDYIDDETGTGMIYVVNKNLNKLFEITVHFDPNEDVTEVG